MARLGLSSPMQLLAQSSVPGKSPCDSNGSRYVTWTAGELGRGKPNEDQQGQVQGPATREE